MSMQIVTQSSLKMYATCPKKYDYRINKELVKDQVVATLEAGTSIHGTLKKFYNYNKEILDPITICDGAQRAMMHAYRSLYYNECIDGTYDGKKILGVEQEFKTQIYHPKTGRPNRNYLQAGKVDLFVRENDGTLGIVDHKTTSLLNGEYIDRITHDQQLYSYAVALELKHKKTVTNLYFNVLCKPTIRQKQTETENDYYERCLEWLTPEKFYRHTVTLDRKFMDEVKQDMWDRTQIMHHSVKNAAWPRNTEACMHWGRICPYFELCMLNQAHLEGTVYIKKRAHNELTELVKNPANAVTSEELRTKNESWIFTFGSNTGKGDKYVKIEGTFGEARAKMVNAFGTHWAFQYERMEDADVERHGLTELKLN